MKYTKQDFIKCAKKFIKREGIDSLLDSLEKTDFYTAPASTRYHHSRKGGLMEHSLEVFEHMKNLSTVYPKGIPYESLAIVGLFHDLCKIGYYVEDTRNVKENGKWKQVPYYTTDDKFPIGHGEKSIIMLRDHMHLTTEEMMAIRWHMGGYEPKENYGTLSKAMEEFPLIIITHSADLLSSYGEGR